MADKKNNFPSSIPQSVYEAMARCILKTVSDYYETDEGKKAFEEWKNNKIDND